MHALGADDNACLWFTSFLSKRTQVTCCSNAKSDPASISIGVAQGSIIGPLLFIVYVNDLPKCLKFCDVTRYADDTVLSFASFSTDEIQRKMNSDLNCIHNWLLDNQLSLNVDKSKFMLIGSSQRLSKLDEITISINDSALANVQSFLYLGILVNQYCTWGDHVTILVPG